MKIYAFKVHSNGRANIEQTLRRASGLTIDQRLRTCNEKVIRLEVCNETTFGWNLDFSLIRHDGPGKAAVDREIENFELSEGEGFGEETAAYIDKNSGFMTIQYNHFGPKTGLIRSYLSRIARECAGMSPGDDDDDQCNFIMAPVLRGNAANRLMSKAIIKSLKFSVYVPELDDNQGGARQGLSTLLNVPITSGVRQISLDISAGSGTKSSLAITKIIIDYFTKWLTFCLIIVNFLKILIQVLNQSFIFGFIEFFFIIICKVQN